MAVEVCVKAATAAPNVLGDCKFIFFHNCMHLSVLIDIILEFYAMIRVFRSLLPKGSPDFGREEGSLQDPPGQSQWEASMVRSEIFNGEVCIFWMVQLMGFVYCSIWGWGLGSWRLAQKGKCLWRSLMTNGCLILMLLLEWLRRNFLSLP